MIKIFITSFLQVFFVAINTVFLAKQSYIGVGIASFMISLIWTYNVKRIVLSTVLERIIYSLGAMTGSLLGLYISSLLI